MITIDTELPLLLAMLGALAVRGNLPQSFSVSLGIVLPFSEFRERQKFHTTTA
jgi:hypothetical protein